MAQTQHPEQSKARAWPFWLSTVASVATIGSFALAISLFAFGDREQPERVEVSLIWTPDVIAAVDRQRRVAPNAEPLSDPTILRGGMVTDAWCPSDDTKTPLSEIVRGVLLDDRELLLFWRDNLYPGQAIADQPGDEAVALEIQRMLKGPFLVPKLIHELRTNWETEHGRSCD